MAKIPYLLRRKSIYYFRIRIPAECQNSLKAHEIIQSLRTENRAEATPVALKLAAHFTASLHDMKIGNAVVGFGKISAVAKGYWTRGIADDILEKQATIEKFDYGFELYRPTA